MIGIIPGTNKTFVVSGYFCSDPIEGQLYVDPQSKRVFVYSKVQTRSCVDNGFFPVWDGQKKIITGFSNFKTLDDVLKFDLESLGKSIDEETAENVILEQKKHNSGNALDPVITNDDNFFTKCIKGVILTKKLSFNDLVENSSAGVGEKFVNIYYSSLVKTAFMRLDKWYNWVTAILHLDYKITVFEDNKELISYQFLSNEFKTEFTEVLSKIETKDPLKKLVKFIIKLKNIVKEQFKGEEIDEYTINNMFTIINGSKPMSAQIFSRFINLAELDFVIEMKEDGQTIFSVKE